MSLAACALPRPVPERIDGNRSVLRMWALLRRVLSGVRARPRAYRLLRDSAVEPGASAGTVVYELAQWDHGCAADDSEAFGLDCLSVTLRPDGQPPFFVVPVRDLAACGRASRPLG